MQTYIMSTLSIFASYRILLKSNIKFSKHIISKYILTFFCTFIYDKLIVSVFVLKKLVLILVFIVHIPIAGSWSIYVPIKMKWIWIGLNGIVWQPQVLFSKRHILYNIHKYTYLYTLKYKNITYYIHYIIWMSNLTKHIQRKIYTREQLSHSLNFSYMNIAIPDFLILPQNLY